MCDDSIPDEFDYLVYDLARSTARLLQDRSDDALRSITWADGESNLDTEFSKLACSCCVEAWEGTVKHSNSTSLGSIDDIRCSIPDINVEFLCNGRVVSQKRIELRSAQQCRVRQSIDSI